MEPVWLLLGAMALILAGALAHHILTAVDWARSLTADPLWRDPDDPETWLTELCHDTDTDDRATGGAS